jgi:hypothetical protein
VPQQFLGAAGPHVDGIERETAAAAPPQVSFNGRSMAVGAAPLQRYTLFPPDRRMIDNSQVRLHAADSVSYSIAHCCISAAASVSVMSCHCVEILPAAHYGQFSAFAPQQTQ